MAKSIEQLIQELGVAPAGVLSIPQGATVRMTVSFKYRGPAQAVTLRCSIGTRVAGVFNESCYKTKSISLTQSTTFQTYTVYADIVTTMNPGTGYDIEAKIQEYTSATLVSWDNVIDVVAPEFQDFAITDYNVV